MTSHPLIIGLASVTSVFIISGALFGDFHKRLQDDSALWWAYSAIFWISLGSFLLLPAVSGWCAYVEKGVFEKATCSLVSLLSVFFAGLAVFLWIADEVQRSARVKDLAEREQARAQQLVREQSHRATQLLHEATYRMTDAREVAIIRARFAAAYPDIPDRYSALGR